MQMTAKQAADAHLDQIEAWALAILDAVATARGGMDGAHWGTVGSLEAAQSHVWDAARICHETFGIGDDA
jgi:hypothetical protein